MHLLVGDGGEEEERHCFFVETVTVETRRIYSSVVTAVNALLSQL